MICEYTAEWQSSGYIVGSHSADEPWKRNGGYLDYDRGFWELGFGAIYPQNSSYERNLNKKYNVKFSTISGNAFLDVEGERLVSSNESQTTSSTNVYIFTQAERLKGSDAGLTGDKVTKAKLYGAKIWASDGTLKFDFVPVRSVWTGEVGLLDKVSGRFFGNSGTGNFVAG